MRVISVPVEEVEPTVHQLFYFLFGNRDKTDLESTEFDVLVCFLQWFISILQRAMVRLKKNFFKKIKHLTIACSKGGREDLIHVV